MIFFCKVKLQYDFLSQMVEVLTLLGHQYLLKDLSVCPASLEKEDKRAAGSPAALTQLALCLRFALLI